MVHFSIDRRKTKTEVIIQPIAVKVDINVGQWELKVKTSILRKTRENACDQIAIGFSLNLIGWEAGASFLSELIPKRSQAIPKYFLIAFRHSVENCSISTFIWFQWALELKFS